VQVVSRRYGNRNDSIRGGGTASLDEATATRTGIDRAS
jgi:hypothetical protein